jgi:toxin-antitoxin system PIN domain toxin
MTDLADVNVLIALHGPQHPFHNQAVTWLDHCDSFATTPIVESGMVRLLLRTGIISTGPVPATVALEMLQRLRTRTGHVFWPDAMSPANSRFAYAIQGPAQVTDLHLLDIAVANGGRLVTFDTKLAACLKPAHRRHVLVL